MRLILHVLFLILAVKIIKSSIYGDIQQNIFTFLKKGKDEGHKEMIITKSGSMYTMKGKLSAAEKHTAHRMGGPKYRAKKSENEVVDRKEIMTQHFGVTKSQPRYHKDPVLNFIRRRSNPSFRRAKSYRDLSSEESSSSSNEIKKWKDQWNDHWVQKKFEAINASLTPGDTVNMVAARPWGVPCGDPNQHDMPWGSCMIPMECEPEYRIYRGDYFCGRTEFVCCALQLNTYDMYQAFDVSFDDSNLSTDSEEKRHRVKGSKEKRKRRIIRAKKRRRKARLKRKRKIKRTIRKIIVEITKILNRSYKNGTTIRKRKTKELKKFIKDLKKQYKKDRKSVKDIHEMELLHMDVALQKKLSLIKGLNNNFLNNATFRDIIVNGTVNKDAQRILLQQYPELRSFVRNRRVGGDDVEDSKDYLEYDIEYGMLYY